MIRAATRFAQYTLTTPSTYLALRNASRDAEPGFVMDYLLFSSRSVWTMIHGVVLGGGALLGLAAALFSLGTIRVTDTAGTADATAQNQARYLGWLLALVAVALWLTVLIGTYVNFPEYRSNPPAGLADLAHYPKALIQSSPRTVWLHSFAMEIKEQMPWITAMLATAMAFVSIRFRTRLLHDASLRRFSMYVLATCFVLVAVVSLLGVFINKIAPLE